jgi:FKBP-type peptidyl-prolyl cis-trans isomerase SlyD
MKIAPNTVVSMTYILSENDVHGNLIQEVTPDRPFVVLFGAGSLIPKFEEKLLGLEPGNRYSFAVDSSEGYGGFNPDAIVELEKEIFLVDGEIDDEILQIGATIPMQNDQGHHMNGVVKEIKENVVVMDFNHPLAGVNLFFTGEILDVREASDEELDHGHVHGEHGHHH